ncbi:MAG: aminotransferase class I/II-fold pyridoxal phosphate-dependent enzyme [Pseudomonadota bacterium]
MTVSKRIQSLTPGGDDGWGVFYRARQMATDGVPVTQLTIGEHDIRTDPIILKAMHKAAKAGHTGYAAVPGTHVLRDRVAARIQAQTGVPTTRENVVITPGGQAGLFAAHMATLDAGQTGLICDPYYATYPGTVRGAGGHVRMVPCHPHHNFEPVRDNLEQAAPGAKTLLINTPNNPTGVVYSRETVETICDVAQAHSLWVISDEVYDSQVWQGTHISPRQIPYMERHTLVVGSMSKSHAMTGSRVGWVCGPAEVIEHLINLSTHTTYGVPGYIQDAAVFAFDQGQGFEAQIAAPFARRRQIAMDLLATQNKVQAVPPQGAMYMMLDIRATGVSGTEFANALLDVHHIAVMPGESFGQAAAGHVRVAMTVDDDAFIQAFETLLNFAAEGRF